MKRGPEFRVGPEDPFGSVGLRGYADALCRAGAGHDEVMRVLGLADEMERWRFGPGLVGRVEADPEHG